MTAPHAPGWAPPPAGPPTWVPPPTSEPAEASPTGQVATFLVVALALCLLLVSGGETPFAVVACVALAGGIGVGLAADLRKLFANLPGFVAGVLAMGALGVLAVIGLAIGLPAPPVQLFPLAFLFVVGLDWRRVDRLRVLVFLGGLPVVIVVGIERGWGLGAAIVWLVAALATLWLLEHDRRMELDAPVPLDPARPAGGANAGDLARTLGIALLIGLAAAFLFGNPSCTFDPPTPNVDPPTDLPTPPPEGSGAPGAQFEEYDLEGRNQERGYQIGEGGERRFTDRETGAQDTVAEGSDGEEVVRNPAGDEVATLDDEGVVAKDPGGEGEGAEQRYQVDPQGRFYVESPDGDRSYLGEEDGEPVLRDGNDEVVARGDGDGHLVVRDPDGRILVDDPDGDGEIPVPDAPTREGIGAIGEPDGRQFESDGDATIVTDPDGSQRTHDVDDQGRPRLRVAEPGQPARTYVSDREGDDLYVEVYDDDGNLIERYRYDPDAITADGQVDPELQDQEQPDQDEADEGGGGSSRLWWVLGAAAVALAVGVFLYLRRRQDDDDPTDRTWAEELQARLEEVGRERGRARGPAETVLEYSAALAGGVLPDGRLEQVGRILSDALFGPAQPSAEVQAWTRATVEEVAEAHPLAGRRKRDEPAATPA